MKRILLSLTVLFLTARAFMAQTSAGTAEISGRVVDGAGQPVAFATILLATSENQVTAGATYSDEFGSFKISALPAGSYLLNITFVGFADYKSQPVELAEGEQLNLGQIAMTDGAKELSEVVVTAKRPLVEVKPDMLVFNVDGTTNATGHTALELLRKSPKVMVDNNNNVMIQGKTGVQVYIDGKPSPLRAEDLANYLDNMQSTEIDAIEIITNPSAKFDAQGNAGIINIRIKKDKNLGANGTANLGYSVGVFSKYNGSVNLNYRNRLMNIFGNYGHNQGQHFNFFNLDRSQLGTRYDQENTSVWNGSNHTARIGTDFFISKKSTIGFLVSGFYNEGDNSSHSRTEISDLETGQLSEILVASNESDRLRKNLNANINYKYDAGQDNSLNIDLDFGRFDNFGDSYQPNFYLDPSGENKFDEKIYTSETPTLIDIATFKVDYEQPLWTGKMGAGIKTSYVKTDNTFDFYLLQNDVPVKDLDRSNRFEYTENVNAAYLSYKDNLSEAWSYQLGLRVEHTHSLGELTSEKETENDRVERDYIDYFPSGGLTWQVNPKNSLSLTYSRRIDRPGYQDLNPFQFKLDELSYRQGNAFLRPQYTHSLEIGHSFNYTLNTSLGYSITDDMFAEITDTADVSSSFIKTENLARQTNINLNVSYPYSPLKWWNIFTNLSAYNSHTEADFGDGKIVDLDVTSFNIYMQHSFTLPAGFSIELSGWFNSPSVWGGVHKTESIWAADAGIQKKLFGGNGNLKLTVSDIFLSQRWRATNTFGILTVNADGGWESRQFRANFTYFFGNKAVKAARKRNTGLEDEKKRVKE